MNCAECQTDPLTPGHYCPCCGRKLSLEEQRAVGGTVPATAPVLANPIVTVPLHESTRADAQKAPVIETRAEATLPPPLAIDVDEIKKAKAKEAADLIAQAHLAKAANPTPVVRRPVVAVPPPPQTQSRTRMLMIAAAVIVGAIGAAEGARRFGFEWPAQAVSEAPPVQMTANAAEVTPPARRAVSREIPSPAQVDPETKPVTAKPASAIAPSRPAVRSKTVAPAEKRTPVRQANPSQDAPVVARNSSPERPAAAAAPARPAASESSRPAAPPTGRFFESNDVDQPPRVASRVAPRLPANLPAGADKRMAVARVLVSSTGHAHHVSLLRGSMLGRASDEAVVAAVTQWTFSPAKKRGEAVNCWYNIGVPLGQAD